MMLASLNYVPESYGIRLRRLYVPEQERGKGEGTRAMREFIARFADVTIRLDPYPFERVEATADEINRLVRFYERFGFVRTGKVVENVPQMERIPLPTSVEMHKRMFGAYWREQHEP